MNSYEATVAGDVVQEIASKIILAAADVLIRHGDDPNSSQLLAAGFVVALRGITKVDPRVGPIVADMLRSAP